MLCLTIPMNLATFAHSEVLAPFFFLIGMQLRNETTHIKQILLPSFAALGGMVFPALIFLSLNSDPLISNGWPLVMPTDIALVMLVLLALGKWVSVELKSFLLALAVADDLLSILVLAGKYSGALKLTEVLASIGAVLLGAVIGKVPLERIFINFVNFIILPLYVVANIYPTITDGLDLSSSLGNSIITARLLGKIIGITLFALLGAKLFKQSLALKKGELIAGSAFAGMGLAVSIMIANLSYPSEALLNQAKAGLLLAAVISAVAGSLILIITNRSNSK
jgi:NhaA family Na+:H+ antiporter